MIPIIIGLIVVVGVFGFYSTAASSTNDSSPVSFESISDVVFSSYSINSKCEMYNAWIDVAKKYDSLQKINQVFIGYTSEDIGLITMQAKEKFYPETTGGLTPHVDSSIYDEYVYDTSLTLFTERVMITNNVHPELEGEVRELLDLIATGDDLESVLRQAILVC